MPVAQLDCRPVQVMLAVEDLGGSVAFYQEAFGLDYKVARRTEHHESQAFVFGEYGRDSFFLLWLLADPARPDRPGQSNFSFLVDDVDTVHERALTAGATEVAAPRDLEGMPRSSRVRDPSGNWVGLAQGWPGTSGCRPVQVMLAVDDLGASIAFYHDAFGLDYKVARRTEHHEGQAFVIGEYGKDNFFLLWLLADPARPDRPGQSNFSFLVGDVDKVHERALTAGATEVAAPRDLEGMPRSSCLRDLSGNWVGLAQG
jgi:predicted enzyme related to lactoylglutathione lyase